MVGADRTSPETVSNITSASNIPTTTPLGRPIADMGASMDRNATTSATATHGVSLGICSTSSPLISSANSPPMLRGNICPKNIPVISRPVVAATHMNLASLEWEESIRRSGQAEAASERKNQVASGCACSNCPSSTAVSVHINTSRATPSRKTGSAAHAPAASKITPAMLLPPSRRLDHKLARE